MHRSTAFLKGYLKKKRVNFLLLVYAFLLLILSLSFSLTKCKGTIPGDEYKDIILASSEKYGISPPLVYAVIECESGFDKNAISPAGASGLMQLMPDTFEWISKDISEKRDIFDPEQNIDAGCRYLSYLLKRFKVTETALAAYNAGEGTVSRWLENSVNSADGVNLKEIPYQETRLYVSKVMLRAEYYEKLLDR